jgi:NAD(P)-dependent dehydrogenase (short-subunit alcohol dehydrogenase family)
MIVITGASDGLGAEVAKLYVADNKRVIGLSRSATPEGVEHIQTDLLNENSIVSAVKTINSESEPLEALINCAGVFGLEKIEAVSAAETDRIIGTNLRGPLLLTSGLMEKIKRDGADIVNVASSVGFKAYPEQGAYGASKWAMRGFSANLQV